MTEKLSRRTFMNLTSAGSAIAIFGGTAGAAGAQGVPAAKLAIPESGRIDVAFMLSAGANVIDTAGPWEVFQDVSIELDGKTRRPFRLFTVAAKPDTITMTGGLKVVPHYTIENAPQPKIIVVPAQSGSDELREWLKTASAGTDVTMSVCTGAIQLAQAGLLDGLKATTHHDFWDLFAQRFPDIDLQRGLRFVDNGHIATAGGLTSGFDMALHVVERYCGRAAAVRTAEYMEYQGYGTE